LCQAHSPSKATKAFLGLDIFWHSDESQEHEDLPD
jgi:hypothetical protein